jgi:hypothetical protein
MSTKSDGENKVNHKLHVDKRWRKLVMRKMSGEENTITN